MKKLLGVFLVLLALVCLLSVTANAQTNVTLSDDLQTLTLGDRTYSRADLSAMAVSFSNTIDHIQVSDARLPCPSPTPGVHSNSCPMSR